MVWYDPRTWGKETPADVPSLGISGITTTGEPVSPPPSTSVSDVARVIDAPPTTYVSSGGGRGRDYTYTAPTTITPQITPEDTKPVHITQQPKDEFVRPGTTTTETRGGLFFVRPGELEDYKGAEPVWETISKTPSGAIDEAKWTSGIKVYPRRTRGSYEATQAQILLAREGARAEREFKKEQREISIKFREDPEGFSRTLGKGYVTSISGVEGTTYTFLPSYFETLPAYKKYSDYFGRFTEEGFLKPEEEKKYILKAKEKFRRLPKGERVKLTIGEVGVAGAQLGIGVTEGLITFGSKLGVQTIKPTDEVKWFGVKAKPFEFKSLKIKQLKETPTVRPSFVWYKEPRKYVKEVITERPAVSFPVGAVAGVGYHIGKGYVGAVKTYGLKTGTLETAKYFTPLRIKQTYFVPDIEKELITSLKQPAKTIEIRYGKEGKQFFQVTEAKTKPLFKYGVEFKGAQYGEVGKDITRGVSISKIKYPYAKYLGGKLTFGQASKEFVSVFQGVPAGQYGFRGKVLTGEIGGYDPFRIKRATIEEVSGFRKDIMGTKRMKVFGFAGGERVEGFEKIAPKTYEYLKGFKPTLRGYGVSFDRGIYKPTGEEKSLVKVFRGGGRKSGDQYFKQLYSQSSATKQTIKPSTTGIELKGVSKLIGTSISKSVLFPITITKTRTKPGIKTGIETKYVKPDIKKITQQAVVLPPIERGIIKTGAVQTTVQIPMITTKQEQKLKTQLKLKQITKQEFPTPTITIPGITGFGGLGVPPQIIPFPRILGGRKGIKKRRRIRMPKLTSEYRPTLGAKWLGLKARVIPKGYKLGLGGVMARGIITSGKKRKKKKITKRRKKKKITKRRKKK